MRIGVVIPTLNEAGRLRDVLEALSTQNVDSIVVSDGGSADNTCDIANEFDVTWVAGEKGRAVQMNRGTKVSPEVDIFWFIHADTIPPSNGAALIRSAVKRGAELGSFRFQFHSKKWYLKINQFFTRFNLLTFRGGDQGIFVTTDAFKLLEGFNENMIIMEEYDLLERAQKSNLKFELLKAAMIVSDRKYDHNGYWQVQWANFQAFRDYRRGVENQENDQRYRKLLSQPTDERLKKDKRSQ